MLCGPEMFVLWFKLTVDIYELVSLYSVCYTPYLKCDLNFESWCVIITKLWKGDNNEVDHRK